MKTEDGQSVAGRIQNLLGDIKQDITSCGNVINKYHQHSTAGESCTRMFSNTYLKLV